MPAMTVAVMVLMLICGACARRDSGGSKSGPQRAQNDDQADRTQKQFPHDSSPAREVAGPPRNLSQACLHHAGEDDRAMRRMQPYGRLAPLKWQERGAGREPDFMKCRSRVDG